MFSTGATLIARTRACMAAGSRGSQASHPSKKGQLSQPYSTLVERIPRLSVEIYIVPVLRFRHAAKRLLSQRCQLSE
jgi:hypothetical protein